jgi:hypothetical protein
LYYYGGYGMHRGKIVRFALAMKVEGMPLPNPAVDGANGLPRPLLTVTHGFRLCGIHVFLLAGEEIAKSGVLG